MKDEEGLHRPEEPVGVVPTLDGIVAGYLRVVSDVLREVGIPEEDVDGITKRLAGRDADKQGKTPKPPRSAPITHASRFTSSPR